MGRDEIIGYLDACGATYAEENIQYLLDNAQGNAYILHHAALRMKEGSPPGSEFRTEIQSAFASYFGEYGAGALGQRPVGIFDAGQCGGWIYAGAGGDDLRHSPRHRAAGTSGGGRGSYQSGNGAYRLRPVLVQALRNRALKV